MKNTLILFTLLFTCNAAAQAEDMPHNPQPFGAWVQEFKVEAEGQGISQALLNKAFANMTPNEKVVRLDRKQPEGTKTFTDYLASTTPISRVDKGRRLYQQHRILLEEIGSKFGVQPRFIIALWGMETSYGGFTGNMSVVRSLATLAYDGRRGEFFRKELLNALKIIDAGHISLDDMGGSWAGAMGQCQFMPSSFLSYAVDYNGDGRKDIWDSLPDIFASIANYLSQSGWDDDLTWGRAVSTPASLDEAYFDIDATRSLAEWNELGVRKADGSALPDRPLINASLIYPGKPHEGAYLIYSNYKVLLKWNRSRYFATAVGTLSDKIGY